jgi:Protein O-mannosyl-transferase TMEM260-like
VRRLAALGAGGVVRSGLVFDLGVSVILALATLASRWPYRARMLYNWDAVQFALALREFDIAKHQPHPPGYVLYVGLGRLVNATLGDPTLAYVTLAMVFSAATTVTVYWLARALYDRTTAGAAAALLAVSPLFWFYGSVGLTYAGEAFGATLMALLAWRALNGRVAHLYVGAVCLGLAGGLRLSVLLLLLPLWGVSAYLGIRDRKRLAAAAALLAAAVLAWFLPLVWLSGGWAAYLRASTDLYRSMVLPTSVLGGDLDTSFRQALHVLESVLVGLGPLALALGALPFYARRRGWSTRERFLVGWIAPPFAVYTLVHFGQAGYVLTFLPALVILLSRAVVELGAAGSERLRRPHWRWALTVAALGPLLLVNSGFFVSARPEPREFDRRGGDAWVWRARDEAYDWILSRTVAALREHEAVLRTYVETIRAVYNPADTVLLTELGNTRSYPWLRHAMFYMPEYAIYQLALRAEAPSFSAPQVLMRGTAVTVPRRVRQLVWFVDQWDPEMPRPRGLLEIQLSYGRRLYVLPLGTGPVEHAGYTFQREPQ